MYRKQEKLNMSDTLKKIIERTSKDWGLDKCSKKETIKP